MSRGRFAASWVLRLLPVAAMAAAGGIGAPAAAIAKPALAATPPMGWSSWYGLRCGFDAATLRAMADRMQDTGLAAAGYDHLNVDDCWAVARDADDALKPDAKRFPGGLKPVADYVHARGLTGR